jgi:hypothetical protein
MITDVPTEVRTGTDHIQVDLVTGNTFHLSVRTGNVTRQCPRFVRLLVDSVYECLPAEQVEEMISNCWVSWLLSLNNLNLSPRPIGLFP